MKMQLQPIRVFCFHHVSEVMNPLVCQEGDWIQLERFKYTILKLSEQYTFISLSDAYQKLHHDMFRCRKYAVLTCDDGLTSVMNILPWLEEKMIPITLFVNTRYMEGDKLKPIHEKWLLETHPEAEMKAIAHEMYLSKKQIWSLTSPMIEIGMHGHEHLNAQHISEAQFEEDLNICKALLHTHPRFIPAFAYPWGLATTDSKAYLLENGILPVTVMGGVNYKWKGTIDREDISNMNF